MQHRYSFVTVWDVTAPVERVWPALAEPLEWPGWWKGVEAVQEIEAGNEDGLGALHRYTWKSALPYKLTFDMRVTLVDRFHRLEGVASGELEGEGVWTFSPSDRGTLVRYTWQIRTTRRWMNALAPVLKPAFKWNHDWVMNSGARSLGRLLSCAVDSGPHRRPGVPRRA